MMAGEGRRSRDKGNRFERELVKRHRALGIDAERVPLSGSAGGSWAGDLRVEGYSCEAKSRKRGNWQRIKAWLGTHDILYIKEDRTEPLVVMTWAVYSSLIRRLVDN